MVYAPISEMTKDEIGRFYNRLENANTRVSNMRLLLWGIEMEK